MSPVLSKFAPALLQIAITVIGAYSLLDPTKGFGGDAFLGLGALLLQAILTYAAPLLPIVWQGALKTGIPAVIAALTLLIPLVAQGGDISSTQWSIVILAGFNTLAAHLGIAIRKAGDAAALASQSPSGVYNVASDGVGPERTLTPYADDTAID